MTGHGLSERHACRLLELDRSSYRYEPAAEEGLTLKQELLELARQKPRYGYRRLWALLVKRGHRVNVKRIYRWYREEKLALRRLKRKKLIRPALKEMLTARPNQEWAMDFVHDRLETGRNLKLLTLVDGYTRECPAIEAGAGLGAAQVTRMLERVIDQRGVPQALRCDNELNASLFLRRRRRSGAQFATRAHRVNRRHRIGHRVVFHEQWDPAHHNEHKICGTNAQSLQRLKQHEGPVEGPSIIYEVEVASTARVRGIDPLGSRCSKKRT
jgi:transposase InsO family protein